MSPLCDHSSGDIGVTWVAGRLKVCVETLRGTSQIYRVGELAMRGNMIIKELMVTLTDLGDLLTFKVASNDHNSRNSKLERPLLYDNGHQ